MINKIAIQLNFPKDWGLRNEDLSHLQQYIL